MKIFRSPRELSDRSIQEVRNVGLLLRPPTLAPGFAPATPLGLFPAPSEVAQRLRGTPYCLKVVDLAQTILEHRFPLLGGIVETGPEIHWRKDYGSGLETGTEYFRRVPYLDAARAGDHKWIWELNRHQHLVLLAQAFTLTGDRGYLAEVWRQIESWLEANPFQRGMNWASALEVGFRALSWMWIYHLIGGEMPDQVRSPFIEGLYRHGCHLANNLSFYFSPNTHLLGEAVALHALGVAFPDWPRARRWRSVGRKVVVDQMRKQVRGDGSHFEQSTYYHVYALDMFRFHHLLEPAGEEYLGKLLKMQEFLDAVMGPSRRLPFLGDDDGGRFFHPFGRRDEFGCRAWEEIGAWWGEPADGPATPKHRSRLFRDSGLAVMVAGDVHAILDAGRFGPWSSGHSHSDCLSLVLRVGEEDVLIDPGTYTYVGNLEERNKFRGSAAHNTLRIDERDQAVPAGPFGWTGQAQVQVLQWAEDYIEAECSHAGFKHKRSVRLEAGKRLQVEDEISGPSGEHLVEQFWHLGSAEAKRRLIWDVSGEPLEFTSEASAAFGEKHPAPALKIIRRGTLPMRLSTTILT